MTLIRTLKSYLKSQDHAEVNLYGIAARCIVTVVDKKIWELQHDSHIVTIQWAVGPCGSGPTPTYLVPILYILVASEYTLLYNDNYGLKGHV